MYFKILRLFLLPRTPRVEVKRTPLPVSILLITDWSIWYACISLLIIYGYALLCLTNLVATATMATMYMVNCVNKFAKSIEKGQFHLPLLQYWLLHMTHVVCMFQSTMPLFKTVILSNIPLIWLITESQICVCMSRSTSPLFKNAIILNIKLI